MSSLPPSRHGGSHLDQELDDRDDAAQEIIMAIEMKVNNTVGCAYYIVVEETLCLQEDIPMAGIEIAETLLLQAEPTAVIIHNRAPGQMVGFPESHAQDLDGSQELAPGMVQGAYVLRTVGSSDFQPNSGLEKLANLDSQIFGQQSTGLNAVAEGLEDVELGGTGTKQSNLMRLATIINLDSRLSIGCAGAVLNELQRRRAVDYLPDDPGAELAFAVRRITMFTLGNSMFVNADTLISLQILRSEHHPNSQMQGPDKAKTGAKEDLSVYGLVKMLSATSQGKAKLRQMFLRPSNDLELIGQRHRSIAVFLRPENKAVIGDIRKWLGKAKDVKTSIANLTKGVHQTSRLQGMKSGVWLTLIRFAQAAIELAGLVHSLAGGRTLHGIAKITTTINTRGIHEVGEMISRDIDFEKSSEAQRSTVKWGVDPELDQLNHMFAGLEGILAQVRIRLVTIMPDWAREHLVNCIFYPQLGFLVAIAINPETGQAAYKGEGLPNDNWVMMFTNEGMVLFKTRMMTELDHTCGDPYGQIVDKEIEIVHALGVRVLRHSEALIAASELYGELDSLIALAMAAEKYNWAAPKMTTSNTIDIREGRHPLQELVVPAFIPNPCLLSGSQDAGSDDPDPNPDRAAPSMIIMTGPNHSGKSIYLKQAALTVYLAHVGSYVPAGHALVGLTDKILTRVSTRESVGRAESAFAIDLRQAAFAIHHATRRSLVLIDEFGKGTNPTDGAALLAALLHHFLSLEERPKVLVATHFHEIFENGYLLRERGVGFGHMDVRVSFEAEEAEDQVAYLFQLREGRSNSSFGTRCAARSGVDRAVVERAEDLSLLLARGEDLTAACARLAPGEEGRLVVAEGVARGFVEMDIPAGVMGPGRGGGSVRAMLGELLGVVGSV